MTVVSLVSCTGAPGVTTTALATAAGLLSTGAPEPAMIELAVSGGVVASQYDLPAEPGLTSLALALGGDDEVDLLDHAQELPGGLPMVAAPPSGSKTAKLVDAKASQLAEYLNGIAATVVADCGRISARSAVVPVLERSTLIGMLVTPSREAFHLAATTIAEVNELVAGRLPFGWVLAGPCPWSHDEIVGQYGMPVLGIMAEDRPGAEAVAGLGKLRRRSPLARSAQSFADDIAKHLRVASPDAPLGYLDHLPAAAVDLQAHVAADPAPPPADPAGGPRPGPTEAAVQ